MVGKFIVVFECLKAILVIFLVENSQSLGKFRAEVATV